MIEELVAYPPRKPVTLYGPRGEAVVQPTLLEVSRAIDPPMQLTGVVEALAVRNVVLGAGDLNFTREPTGLLDQHGKRIYR